MNTGKTLTDKIVKKKLSEVVEIEKTQPSPLGSQTSGGLFDDLEDDLFDNPLDIGYGSGSSGSARETSRETQTKKLKTYGWERSRPSRRTRISDREILDEKDGGVPTRWNFASKYEADKSISRNEKCDEVIQTGLSKAMRFAGKDAEFHAVTTEELTEIIRDAFTEGAHFRKENP